MKLFFSEKTGKWSNARGENVVPAPLPEEKRVRGGTPDAPGQAPAGGVTGRLSSREILGLQVATGGPVNVETRGQAEALGLTFETTKLRPPGTGRFDKFKKEEIKNTFMEVTKASRHISPEIAKKLKEGYRLTEAPDGGFTLEKPTKEVRDALVPGQPDGVDYVPEGKEVPGYDESQPVVDFALLQTRAKENAQGRRTARRAKGSEL